MRHLQKLKPEVHARGRRASHAAQQTQLPPLTGRRAQELMGHGLPPEEGGLDMMAEVSAME